MWNFNIFSHPTRKIPRTFVTVICLFIFSDIKGYTYFCLQVWGVLSTSGLHKLMFASLRGVNSSGFRTMWDTSLLTLICLHYFFWVLISLSAVAVRSLQIPLSSLQQRLLVRSKEGKSLGFHVQVFFLHIRWQVLR